MRFESRIFFFGECNSPIPGDAIFNRVKMKPAIAALRFLWNKSPIPVGDAVCNRVIFFRRLQIADPIVDPSK